VLRSIAATDPGYFATGEHGYEQDGLRLDRQGVWRGSRLLADRSALVERIPRTDVREVRIPGPGGTHAHEGTLIGLGVGAAYGYMIGSRCGPVASPGECRVYGFVMMQVFGGIGVGIGALVGSSAEKPSDRVLYAIP